MGLMTRVYYLAHPVGADPFERELNLVRVQHWFGWLLGAYPHVAIIAPWHLYVINLEETAENRARGIRDDMAVLERCDGVFLTGGRLSMGMAAELELAKERGLHVVDLLELGPRPPTP